MPRKTKTVKFGDPLARRLSFRDAVGRNEVISTNFADHRPNGVAVENARDSHNIRPQKEVGDCIGTKYTAADTDYTQLFPVFVFAVLALLAVFLMLRDTITVSSYDQKYDLIGVTKSLCWSVFFGLACTIISWMVTFSDSLEPGSNPPSPMSPQKLRERSGHTFHSSYVICIVNGALTTAICFWYLNS